MITIETPKWISKQPKCQNPRSNKQTNKLKKYLMKIVMLLQKSVSAKFGPVRTLEYN